MRSRQFPGLPVSTGTTVLALCSDQHTRVVETCAATAGSNAHHASQLIDLGVANESKNKKEGASALLLHQP